MAVVIWVLSPISAMAIASAIAPTTFGPRRSTERIDGVDVGLVGVVVTPKRKDREADEHEPTDDLNRTFREGRAEETADDHRQKIGDSVAECEAECDEPKRMLRAEAERQQLCLVAEFGDEDDTERRDDRRDDVDHGTRVSDSPRWRRPGRAPVSSPSSAMTWPRFTVAT